MRLLIFLKVAIYKTIVLVILCILVLVAPGSSAGSKSPPKDGARHRHQSSPHKSSAAKSSDSNQFAHFRLPRDHPLFNHMIDILVESTLFLTFVNYFLVYTLPILIILTIFLMENVEG